MGKIRGFPVRHRVNTFFRCFRRGNRHSSGYYPLNSPPPCFRANAISRLFSWTDDLKTKAKAICSGSSKHLAPGRSGCMQFGHGSHGGPPKPAAVPKGQMAVYVGQKDGDFHRVLMPVIYINHPLFGQLLREAEEEFGYNHPGGITLPCRMSEFEHVQTRIKQCRPTRRLLSWKRQT